MAEMTEHWAEAFIGKQEQEDSGRGKAIREGGQEGGNIAAESKKALAAKKLERILELQQELHSKNLQWKNNAIAEQIHEDAQAMKITVSQKYPGYTRSEMDLHLLNEGYVNLAVNTIQKKLPPLPNN